jgi:hypothetical protein
MKRHESLGHQPAPAPQNGAAPRPAPAPAPVPWARIPFPLLQGIVEYLKKRPYDEVAAALAAIATQCKNADGTSLEVTMGSEVPNA